MHGAFAPGSDHRHTHARRHTSHVTTQTRPAVRISPPCFLVNSMLRSFEQLLFTKRPGTSSMIHSSLLTLLQVGQVHDALGTLKFLKDGKTYGEDKKTQRHEFKEKEAIEKKCCGKENTLNFARTYLLSGGSRHCKWKFRGQLSHLAILPEAPPHIQQLSPPAA